MSIAKWIRLCHEHCWRQWSCSLHSSFLLFFLNLFWDLKEVQSWAGIQMGSNSRISRGRSEYPRATGLHLVLNRWHSRDLGIPERQPKGTRCLSANVLNISIVLEILFRSILQYWQDAEWLEPQSSSHQNGNVQSSFEEKYKPWISAGHRS